MRDPLTRAVRPIRHRKKQAPLSQKVLWTYRTLLLVLLFLGFSATGTYLYLSTLQPSKGYTLEQLQADKEILESFQRKLDQQSTEARSFVNLETNKAIDSMAPISNDQTSFVQNSSVAKTLGDSEHDRYTP